jgi:hypothetical protein
MFTGSTFATGSANTWKSEVGFAGMTQMNALGDEMHFTGIQLEEGTKASEFVYEDVDTTLDKVSRFFQTFGGGAVGRIGSATTVEIGGTFTKQLRVSPGAGDAGTLGGSFVITQIGTGAFTANTPSITATYALSSTGYAIAVAGFTGMSTGVICFGNNPALFVLVDPSG